MAPGDKTEVYIAHLNKSSPWNIVSFAEPLTLPLQTLAGSSRLHPLLQSPSYAGCSSSGSTPPPLSQVYLQLFLCSRRDRGHRLPPVFPGQPSHTHHPAQQTKKLAWTPPILEDSWMRETINNFALSQFFFFFCHKDSNKDVGNLWRHIGRRKYFWMRDLVRLWKRCH